MQSKEITEQETRTFKEICNSLTRGQRHDLVVDIMSKLRVTERTAQNWMYGKKPMSWSQQLDIARIIKSSFGITTPVTTLAEKLFNY